MDVNKERLCIIGKMIGVYREERRANTQNCWTQKRFCKDICSTNTLKSIETGGLARSIDVYDDLLAKFDLKLGEFPAIDDAVLKLTDDLYEAIEFFCEKDIQIILLKIHRVLDKVKDYVYYSELKYLFTCIQNHYQNYLLIENGVVDRLKQTMYILPTKFADLYRSLIYSKLKANSISSKINYRDLVKDISMESCEHNYIKINLIDYYYILDSYKTMEDLIEELLDIFDKEKKYTRLVDVYNCAIILLGNVEFKRCKHYINQAEKMLFNLEIPAFKKSDLYSNIAVVHQINSQFEVALQYFNKMLEIPHRNSIDSYIFMADCQNHLKLPINIPIVTEDCYAQYPEDVKLMYKYFTFDEEYADFSKENYIIKKILPTLTDESYIKVFRFEINKLVSQTGHYKASHVFNLRVQENISNKS